MKNNRIIKNTSWLMVFNIAKMVFPFITLPYLTRVLDTGTYGAVAYVKTIMSYLQILVDFGFGLSATKAIVNAKNNQDAINKVVGDTVVAKLFLGLIAFIILLIMMLTMPILQDNIVFTILSYIVVLESIFLMDFLFRGLETMHIIAIRFLIMKSFSTILTFVFVKNESDLLLIPIFDIIGSLIAIALVFINLYNEKIKLKVSSVKNVRNNLKESFVYFLSNVAAVSFNALGTVIIGISLSTTDVAYWSICMQIVTAIQAFYSPISEGIYPEMIRTKNLQFVKALIRKFVPILLSGCIFSFFVARYVLRFLGEEYINAETTFRLLIPTLFFGFFSVIYGWPVLGAIGKAKETTISTVVSILFQFLSMIVLLVIGKFTLINIAIVRSLTEIILFGVRYYYCIKYKTEFID